MSHIYCTSIAPYLICMKYHSMAFFIINIHPHTGHGLNKFFQIFWKRFPVQVICSTYMYVEHPLFHMVLYSFQNAHILGMSFPWRETNRLISLYAGACNLSSWYRAIVSKNSYRRNAIYTKCLLNANVFKLRLNEARELVISHIIR